MPDVQVRTTHELSATVDVLELSSRLKGVSVYTLSELLREAIQHASEERLGRRASARNHSVGHYGELHLWWGGLDSDHKLKLAEVIARDLPEAIVAGLAKVQESFCKVRGAKGTH